MGIELFLGLAIGLVMALTGAGGGILAVPILIFGLRLGINEAAPVGLLAVGVSAALGAVLGLRAGIVRYKAALLMATTGVLFAPIGVWILHCMDTRVLSVLFAMVLLFISVRTFRQAGKDSQGAEANNGEKLPCVRSASTGKFIWNVSCARALAIAGSIAGLLSGLLGVGGGFVIVPTLKRHTDLPMQSVIATSLAVIALVSVSGVIASASGGTLNGAIAMPFAAGTMLGMVIGRMAASHIAGAVLQKAFALVSALVAVGMILKVAA